MKTKEQRFHTIMDIYAFRVVVDTADTCYRVLGQVHSLYKPRPGRMKDYIAVPKANGYQSTAHFNGWPTRRTSRSTDPY